MLSPYGSQVNISLSLLLLDLLLCLGIAVLNGVVLVTYFNQLRALGRDIDEVVIQGARTTVTPGNDDCEYCCLLVDPTIVCDGSRLRNSAAAGNRCHRRADHVNYFDAINFACVVSLAQQLRTIMNRVLLTIICPPSLERPITDWLLEQDVISGFTSIAGTTVMVVFPDSLTLIEQVEGRKKQFMFQIHIPSDHSRYGY